MAPQAYTELQRVLREAAVSGREPQLTPQATTEHQQLRQQVEKWEQQHWEKQMRQQGKKVLKIRKARPLSASWRTRLREERRTLDLLSEAVSPQTAWGQAIA